MEERNGKNNVDEQSPSGTVEVDATGQKQIEEALSRSREHYEALVLASAQIVWTTGADGKANADSASWRAFTGQTRDEWLRQGWDVIHPDDRERSRRAWEEAIRTGTNYEVEYRVRHKSGEYRWTAVRGVALKNRDGAIREWVGMNTDIHEQRQTEDLLRESSARREFVLESAKIGEWELDLTTGKVRRNSIHDQCFGAGEPLPEWSYDIFLSYVHAADRPEVQRKFDAAIAGQTEWNFECRVVWADRSIHWIQAKGNFYRRANEENLTLMMGIVADITERKQSEENLRASEEFNRSVIASSPDCIKILDIEGRLQFMNDDGFCLMEIDDFERVKGQIWTEFWKGEAYSLATAAFEKAKRGEVGKFQGFCRTAKGTPKWWDVVVSPVRGARGEISRLLSISRDITANKRTEQEREESRMREINALKQSEVERQKLESLFKQAPAIINIMRGAEHFFDLIHPRMPELLGDRDYLNKPIREVFPEPEYESFIELMSRVYQTGETYLGSDTPIWLKTPEGRREGYFDFIYQAWRDIDGEIGGVLSLGVEVTDRVLARQAMERAAAEREAMLEREQQLRKTAEEASRLKDEFLATVSHELRTPLNAIIGWSQMMRSGVVEADQYEKAIETIDRNARSQAQLIDDLLDITRIITGKLRLNVAEINFAAIIDAAVQTVRPAAQAKNVRVFVNAAFGKAEISGDAERLQQVVWNLLSNAVKFTPKNGEIFVTLETLGSHLKLSVMDTGEGIEPEFLPFVFDRFSQADMSSTRRMGGLGLGLSIVRHLVEMHGGSIGVSSEGTGKGAVFTVTLPINVDVNDDEDETLRSAYYPDAARSAPTVRLDGVKILVVDDEPDACEVLEILLEQCGAHVLTAGSASEALEIISAGAPDVLISDIAMPDEDGYALIGKIRRLPKDLGGAIPAIALTAYAGQTDRKKALDAGFHSHITKPVDQNALVTILASLV